jgi:hypothetical protein
MLEDYMCMVNIAHYFWGQLQISQVIFDVRTISQTIVQFIRRTDFVRSLDKESALWNDTTMKRRARTAQT